uniref:Uncharacterized protein n=1 Tax=Stegastes partitus TaxID=144197 RepID=A0A3B5BH36_9TELE
MEGFSVLLLLCIFFIILQLKSRRPKNFPPGPPTLPIVGNLLQLNLHNPLEDFERVRKRLQGMMLLFQCRELLWSQ